MEAYANRKSRRRAHTGLTDASPLLRARNAKLAINRHRRESDATKPFGEEDEQELFNHAQIDETDPDQLEYVSRFFRDLQRPLSRRLLMRRRKSPRLEYQLSRALDGMKGEGLIVGPRQHINGRYGMD